MWLLWEFGEVRSPSSFLNEVEHARVVLGRRSCRARRLHTHRQRDAHKWQVHFYNKQVLYSDKWQTTNTTARCTSRRLNVTPKLSTKSPANSGYASMMVCRSSMVILCKSQYEMVLTVYRDLPAWRDSSKYDFFTSSPNMSSLPAPDTTQHKLRRFFVFFTALDCLT